MIGKRIRQNHGSNLRKMNSNQLLTKLLEHDLNIQETDFEQKNLKRKNSGAS